MTSANSRDAPNYQQTICTLTLCYAWWLLRSVEHHEVELTIQRACTPLGFLRRPSATIYTLETADVSRVSKALPRAQVRNTGLVWADMLRHTKEYSQLLLHDMHYQGLPADYLHCTSTYKHETFTLATKSMCKFANGPDSHPCYVYMNVH